ncbi:MAG: Rossmann-fold NAD(P)-binding domain-containing protein, partial [Actinomycetes bacterium]
MRIVVPCEVRPGEQRVAMVPEVVPLLLGLGAEVVVEHGAGQAAFASDEAYRAAGAEVRDGDVLVDADAVLTVSPLTVEQARRLPEGAVTIGFLAPEANLDLIRTYRDRGVSGFSFELVPRISRAQSMDALTSQALVAGYRATLVAAAMLPRFFPLYMTAAGTIPPARVLVLGAGVAGLQAIGTARRLGAVVEAYDVRTSSAEEVRSMGAAFVNVDLEVLEAAGGYAREMGEDRARR